MVKQASPITLQIINIYAWIPPTQYASLRCSMTVSQIALLQRNVEKDLILC